MRFHPDARLSHYLIDAPLPFSLMLSALSPPAPVSLPPNPISNSPTAQVYYSLPPSVTLPPKGQNPLTQLHSLNSTLLTLASFPLHHHPPLVPGPCVPALPGLPRLLLVGGLEHLEGAQQFVIDAHDGGSVVELLAVVGGGEDGDLWVSERKFKFLHIPVEEVNCRSELQLEFD